MKGMTPLHIALKNNKVNFFEILLVQIQISQILDFTAQTGLKYAFKMGNSLLIDLL